MQAIAEVGGGQGFAGSRLATMGTGGGCNFSVPWQRYGARLHASTRPCGGCWRGMQTCKACAEECSKHPEATHFSHRVSKHWGWGCWCRTEFTSVSDCQVEPKMVKEYEYIIDDAPRTERLFTFYAIRRKVSVVTSLDVWRHESWSTSDTSSHNAGSGSEIS